MEKVDNLLSEIYFHELSSREHIFNRLQLNLAIYVSVFTIVAYMCRMIDLASNCVVLTLFFIGIFVGIALIAVSINLTIRSLTGFEYSVFPRAKEIVEYRIKLSKYAEDIEKYNQEYGLSIKVLDATKETNEYVFEIIAECIDGNFKINEYRNRGIRKSIWYMIRASLPILMSATLFVIFDLDASSPRKNKLIEDRNMAAQLEVLGSMINSFNQKKTIIGETAMTDDQSKKPPTTTTPPPPPPPPQKPERQISTEDFQGAMPKNVKTLNEGK